MDGRWFKVGKNAHQKCLDTEQASVEYPPGMPPLLEWKFGKLSNLESVHHIWADSAEGKAFSLKGENAEAKKSTVNIHCVSLERPSLENRKVGVLVNSR